MYPALHFFSPHKKKENFGMRKKEEENWKREKNICILYNKNERNIREIHLLFMCVCVWAATIELNKGL